LQCTSNPGRSDDEKSEIKSALFEIRFAYAIHCAGCIAEYECSSGIGNSTVDFLIHGKNNQSRWLVELTSLRESKAIKNNTSTCGNVSECVSISSQYENSIEVIDIIKVQQAILH
jgi:hypothetical protein